MMLSEEIKDAILELQRLYPIKRSALIPALHLAQTELGYLPREIQNEVADLFDLDPNEVYSVVTFYDMFFEKPVGKHLIHVCKNISCMLRGADEVIDRVCQRLRIKPGETTEDGEFTLIASECLGACDLAPMMLADEKVVGSLNEMDVERILAKAREGSGHPSPIPVPQCEGYHG